MPKPASRFNEGDRRNNIEHIRIRMACSSLNFHLHYNIHVMDNPKCICGLDGESIEHYFFFSCPLYLNLTCLSRSVGQLYRLMIPHDTQNIICEQPYAFNSVQHNVCI